MIARIGGQGLGLVDQRQTLEDFLFLTAVMAVENIRSLLENFLELR